MPYINSSNKVNTIEIPLLAPSLFQMKDKSEV
jgi:hypothetical protein